MTNKVVLAPLSSSYANVIVAKQSMHLWKEHVEQCKSSVEALENQAAVYHELVGLSTAISKLHSNAKYPLSSRIERFYCKKAFKKWHQYLEKCQHKRINEILATRHVDYCTKVKLFKLWFIMTKVSLKQKRAIKHCNKVVIINGFERWIEFHRTTAQLTSALHQYNTTLRARTFGKWKVLTSKHHSASSILKRKRLSLLTFVFQTWKHNAKFHMSLKVSVDFYQIQLLARVLYKWRRSHQIKVIMTQMVLRQYNEWILLQCFRKFRVFNQLRALSHVYVTRADYHWKYHSTLKAIDALRSFACEHKFHEQGITFVNKKHNDRLYAKCFSRWIDFNIEMKKLCKATKHFKSKKLVEIFCKWKNCVKDVLKTKRCVQSIKEFHQHQLLLLSFKSWISAAEKRVLLGSAIESIVAVRLRVLKRLVLQHLRHILQKEYEEATERANAFASERAILFSHRVLLHWKGYTYRVFHIKKLLLLYKTQRALKKWIQQTKLKLVRVCGNELASTYNTNRLEAYCFNKIKNQSRLSKTYRIVKQRNFDSVMDLHWSLWNGALEKRRMEKLTSASAYEFAEWKGRRHFFSQWYQGARLLARVSAFVKHKSVEAENSQYVLCRSVSGFTNDVIAIKYLTWWRLFNRSQLYRRKKKMHCFIMWKHHALSIKYDRLERSANETSTFSTKSIKYDSKVLRNWKRHSLIPSYVT